MTQRIVSFVEATPTPVNGRSFDVLALGRVDADRVAHVLGEWERRSRG